MKPKLTKKQREFLVDLKVGYCVEILSHEMRTARSLEKRGMLEITPAGDAVLFGPVPDHIRYGLGYMQGRGAA